MCWCCPLLVLPCPSLSFHCSLSANDRLGGPYGVHVLTIPLCRPSRLTCWHCCTDPRRVLARLHRPAATLGMRMTCSTSIVFPVCSIVCMCTSIRRCFVLAARNPARCLGLGRAVVWEQRVDPVPHLLGLPNAALAARSARADHCLAVGQEMHTVRACHSVRLRALPALLCPIHQCALLFVGCAGGSDQITGSQISVSTTCRR
jgi:hypothetical protein